MMAGAEEHRIGHALASVAGWVAEIVVVINDTVTDKTEQIAQSFGASVYREPWKGFIGQSNSAREKCTQEWILGLDADEVVSEKMRESIFHFFETEAPIPDAPNGLRFHRCTWFMGQWIRHGDWYPDTQLRLFRRTKGKWGGKEPHHKVILEGSTKVLHGDILHYSHASLADYHGKIQYFTSRFVTNMEAHEKTSSGWTIAARALWRFFRAFILKRGFLDGPIGFYLALSQAFFTAHRHWSLSENRLQSSEKRLFGLPLRQPTPPGSNP